MDLSPNAPGKLDGTCILAQAQERLAHEKGTRTPLKNRYILCLNFRMDADGRIFYHSFQ